MTLCDWEIEESELVEPFVGSKQYLGCLSYGLGTHGYDVRLAAAIGKWYHGSLVDPCQNIVPESLKMIAIESPGYVLSPGEFVLGCSLEKISLPKTIKGEVKDKSTLIRLGIAVQNTVLEAGWRGQVTFEISNHGPHQVILRAGMPIAQIEFEMIKKPNVPYDGRYQDQEGVTAAKRGPVSTAA